MFGEEPETYTVAAALLGCPDPFDSPQGKLPDECRHLIEIIPVRVRLLRQFPEYGVYGIIETLADHAQGTSIQDLLCRFRARKFGQDGGQDKPLRPDIFLDNGLEGWGGL